MRQTPPIIAINPISVVAAACCGSGHDYRNRVGADGQAVVVQLFNPHGTLVDQIHPTAIARAWTSSLPSTVVQTLADGTYIVVASVLDQFGNAADPVIQPITVHEISANDHHGGN